MNFRKLSQKHLLLSRCPGMYFDMPFKNNFERIISFNKFC